MSKSDLDLEFQRLYSSDSSLIVNEGKKILVNKTGDAKLDKGIEQVFLLKGNYYFNLVNESDTIICFVSFSGRELDWEKEGFNFGLSGVSVKVDSSKEYGKRKYIYTRNNYGWLFEKELSDSEEKYYRELFENRILSRIKYRK
ncbi:MAG: hypothetical protein SFU91_05385 [Chloroherpetonaceae bacterium]|nr:hypothetical protein [Chloroherpetonaceae bacterium]